MELGKFKTYKIYWPGIVLPKGTAMAVFNKYF